MCGYKSIEDILPCPDTQDGKHDWCDYRNCSDDYYNGECTHCAALIRRHWWGWEFRTGQEHFDDFRDRPEEYERDFNKKRRPAPIYARGGPRGDPVIAAHINANTGGAPLQRIGGGENWGVYGAAALRGIAAHFARAQNFYQGIQEAPRGIPREQAGL